MAAASSNPFRRHFPVITPTAPVALLLSDAQDRGPALSGRRWQLVAGGERWATVWGTEDSQPRSSPALTSTWFVAKSLRPAQSSGAGIRLSPVIDPAPAIPKPKRNAGSLRFIGTASALASDLGGRAMNPTDQRALHGPCRSFRQPPLPPLPRLPRQAARMAVSTMQPCFPPQDGCN